MNKLEEILRNNPNAFKKDIGDIKKDLKKASKRMADYKKQRAIKSANPKSGEYYSPIKTIKN